MGTFVKVAKKSDVARQSAKCIKIEDQRIALFNLDGEFHAIGDVCTHWEGSLSAGTIEGDEVQCPLHGAYFNIKTGKPTYPPAYDAVPTYNVRVNGDDIEIEI